VFYDFKTGKRILNILIIRRDNIGDLLCTTPLIRGLKEQLKVDRLDVVTNAYVAPVLKGNYDIDVLFIYHKLKHGHTSLFKAAYERLRLLFNLRQRHYDYILAFDQRASNFARYLKKTNILTPIQNWAEKTEVERVWELGQRLGLKGIPGPMSLPIHLYDPNSNSKRKDINTLGIHISARRIKQQYPISKWIELINQLYKLNPKLRFNIFWSPGDNENPRHPGDDEKAYILKDALQNIPAKLMPTPTLETLIAGIQTCGSMIMADGGAMHIAAALNCPLVAIFGDSNAKRWRPWAVSHEVIISKSMDVKEIKTALITKAWLKLMMQK
jgi:ADP-heptose:LPS heptosyltransferase